MSEENKIKDTENLEQVTGGVGFGEVPPCPKCGSKDATYLNGHDDIDFFRCNKCGERYHT